jgi:Skp family chaperone for outer membrane proteins
MQSATHYSVNWVEVNGLLNRIKAMYCLQDPKDIGPTVPAEVGNMILYDDDCVPAGMTSTKIVDVLTALFDAKHKLTTNGEAFITQCTETASKQIHIFFRLTPGYQPRSDKAVVTSAQEIVQSVDFRNKLSATLKAVIMSVIPKFHRVEEAITRLRLRDLYNPCLHTEASCPSSISLVKYLGFDNSITPEEAADINLEWESYVADTSRNELKKLYCTFHKSQQDLELQSYELLNQLEGKSSKQPQSKNGKQQEAKNGKQQEATEKKRDEIQAELLKNAQEKEKEIILKAIEFWSSPIIKYKYSHLHKMGLRYALATATTCGVERVFSSVTRMESDTTARSLQEDGFKQSLFLQCHRELVEQYAIDAASKVPSFQSHKKKSTSFRDLWNEE